MNTNLGKAKQNTTRRATTAAILSAFAFLAPLSPAQELESRIVVEESVQKGKQIAGSAPVYPPIAVQARVEGVVRLQIVVTKDGTVKDIEFLSGHLLFRESAKTAVETFRYSPTVKDGNPVEVSTRVRLQFFLTPGGEEARLNGQREKVRKRPGDADARRQLAYYLHESGFVPEAEKEFREVIAAKPKLAEAHFGLSDVLAERGELEEAIAECRTGIAADSPSSPYYENGYVDLARLLEKKGAFDEALAVYRERARKNPGDATRRYNLAGALVRRGALDEAIVEYRIALKREPDWAGLHFALGQALEKKGDLEGALKEYKTAANSKYSPAAHREAYERLWTQLKNK